MIYLQLFLSFLQVGMFSVGGGYAAMPLIQSQVVEQHGWLTMQEFTDLITIAEMTPGPIAVNSATFVGLRIAQAPGAIIATLGCIGGNAKAFRNVDWIGVSSFAVAFFALRKLRRNPILTMCLCGVAGLGLHVLFGV